MNRKKTPRSCRKKKPNPKPTLRPQRKSFLSIPWLYLRSYGNDRIPKSDLDLKKWRAHYLYLLRAFNKNKWNHLLPGRLDRAIHRKLQRRYLQNRHPSSFRRTLFFRVAGAFSVSLLLFLPWLLRLLENIGGLKFPQAVPDIALMLLFGAPVFWLIWFFRDRNKILETQNGRRAASLTEFQKLQERACSKEDNLELRLSALQQLRPYLRGEEDNIFHRAAYETLRTLLNQLQGTSSAPQKTATASAPPPQEDSAATASTTPLHRNEVDCLRQIAQEEWYALLLHHPYSMSHLVLEGVKFVEPLYLAYRSLEHLHAPHAWLPNSILYQANLSGANLSGANLSGANLSGANLSGANLSGANLSGANLSGANLSGANLSAADLSGANLSAADLSAADLSAADLSAADLSAADLSAADLHEAKLHEAKLRWADLTQADLTEAHLTQADLSRANLTGTTVTQEQWNQALSWEGCSPPPTVKA